MKRVAKKKRIPIPKTTAAEVLFKANRTCCVCRDESRLNLQIHHMDDDPSNNVPDNLAVLCIDCHQMTQVRGGFARQLDSEQIRLYRDDWKQIVANSRSQGLDAAGPRPIDPENDLELTTSLIELYQEQEAWPELATLYHSLGNEKLRDKYIEKAIDAGVSPGQEVSMRSRQGRLDLIDLDAVEKLIKERQGNEAWLASARLLLDLGRYYEGLKDLVRAIGDLLDKDNSFSAAYYLREVASNDLVKAAYVTALQEASDEGNVWWQVRAFEELGWTSELHAFVLECADAIDDGSAGHSPWTTAHLREVLAQARDDRTSYLKHAVDSAEALARDGTFPPAKQKPPATETDHK